MSKKFIYAYSATDATHTHTSLHMLKCKCLNLHLYKIIHTCPHHHHRRHEPTYLRRHTKQLTPKLTRNLTTFPTLQSQITHTSAKKLTMAKKNNNNGVENKNKNNDGGEKKKKAIASKIVKWVKSFQGAESVKSEGQANKLTVVGKVDPTKLRDELATKTKNKVDLVSPQPEKDNKVNKDDANDTKKKQPEKTDNDEKAKKAPLTTAVMKVDFQCQKCKKRAMKIASSTPGCDSVSVDMEKGYLIVTGSMDVLELVKRLRVRRMAATILSVKTELVPRKKVGGGGDDDDGNNYEGNGGGGGGGGGDKKKKEEDEGNGGGKMKYPAGQYGFGQFSYRTVHRHGYGYQNGALKMGEKMLLMCCEVFGLLVMYNHLAKDIYTKSIHNVGVFSGCKATFTFLISKGCK
ncbi:PREDICTED: heavy [Prunus dulcis]|uniref:PREDICTED: heavy n=1 Tax=Prunus dulcis TaxID=3755 RepID=A0A5E4GKZ6_PRUDU|nr:heavy metal-associated isoprenylated plant protein 3-like [Prunus dulcis]VVA40293.1 PREDICTED: heavy [Prunus dulcis]